jgi:predicted alpha-1,2-mannosidase
MKRLSYFLVLFMVVCFFSFKEKREVEYTQYVSTFIGTDGTGHSFPGPCLPFGMVQPGPDNVNQGWDYTSGYQYQDSMIAGFSQTRANGTGISEFGDILLQPFTVDKKENFGESYIKETEKASPGYYAVTLKNQVQVALTCTERVAYHQYTYPTNTGYLLVDLQHGLRFITDSLVLESNVQIEGNNTISGYCHTKNWVNRKYFFTIVFNHPFSQATLLERKAKEAAPRYVLQFDLKNQILETKIALSTVSVAGAIQNLNKELPNWDFKKTVNKAKQIWNSYLNRIVIDADNTQKTIFYSCLYRLFIQPSNIADVDGKYRGADDSIRIAKNGEYYSTLSLWDTYRAANPLYTLIAPERVNGIVNTLIEHSKAAGFLPIWTAWGQDNYCMIGNHAIPVIVDAYMKGFKGFDANTALDQMIQSTTVNHINSNWSLLEKYGYYPFDSLDNEAVSRTLEHGVDDYCIALMAEKMGKKALANKYYHRASFYKNLFDSSTKQMRGKDSKGHWRDPFNPLMATSPMNNPGDYTEANAWQYFWTPAQYDLKGVTQLLKGKKGLTEQLDSFFSIKSLDPNKHLGQEAMIGQYAHGNEPSHHIAYLYAFSEKPQKGKDLIQQIYQQFYSASPSGMIGNDDCGQMSAWYIFATLGFYPVNPVMGDFVLGMPQVANAQLRLTNQKTLYITNQLNHHQGLNKFNEKAIHTTINYHDLKKGGNLVFQ